MQPVGVRVTIREGDELLLFHRDNHAVAGALRLSLAGNEVDCSSVTNRTPCVSSAVGLFVHAHPVRIHP